MVEIVNPQARHRQNPVEVPMRSSTVGLLVLCILDLFALPLVAVAQPSRTVPRVGMLLVVGSAVAPNPSLDAFRQGLRELGWVEGQNISLEYRHAEGRYERLPDLAAELVHLSVDVIFASSSPGAQAAKQATTTLPIVFETLADPVAAGLVEGLARPGGNLTGVSGFAPALSGKCLDLLKEVVPGLTRVAILLNPGNPSALSNGQETERAARAVGVQLQRVEVREPAALEGALATVLSAHADGLIVVPDPMVFGQRQRIVEWAAKSRLPVMYSTREFVEAGGLMAYGVSLPAQWRRAAYYVDRILKGHKPADLPVEQPREFELLINRTTAQVLGLTLPPLLLYQATEVIQ